jgi:preprotein translocase subunit SecG
MNILTAVAIAVPIAVIVCVVGIVLIQRKFGPAPGGTSQNDVHFKVMDTSGSVGG